MQFDLLQWQFSNQSPMELFISLQCCYAAFGYLPPILTLTVLVTTIDALRYFETG